MKKLLQIIADIDAQEVAELAIVIPILLMLVFGVFSFGRAYNIYSTVTRAAQDAARFASSPSCVVGCTPYTCAGNSSQLPCASDVAGVVNAALLASHLDPNQVTVINPATTACPDPAPPPTCSPATLGTTRGQISVCQYVAVNANNVTTNAALQTCGMIVTFQYSYKFLPVPFLTFNSINIPAQAQVQVEF